MLAEILNLSETPTFLAGGLIFMGTAFIFFKKIFKIAVTIIGVAVIIAVIYMAWSWICQRYFI